MKRSWIKRKSKPFNREQYNKDWQFYEEIWESMDLPRRCFETNSYLGSELLSTMIHHVLPKEKYPQYRHEKWNIVVIKPEVHEQVHLNIDKCPKIKERYNHLKNQYA